MAVKKEGDPMPSEKELIDKLIDKYTDLQRIKTAADVQKEIDYQLAVTRVKLESCGIVTSDLDIK